MKTTKRALLTSVMALILCFSMLVGTTFAWFTDEVKSDVNKIVAGNLDVNLHWSTDATNWTAVDANTNVFKSEKWEPGHTEVVYLKVVNEGTLALKYQLGVQVAGETGSVNVKGEAFKLSDFIKYRVMDYTKTYAADERDMAIADAEKDAGATKLNEAYNSGTLTLAAAQEKIVTMVVYMPTSVGNEANYAKGAAEPTIMLGINLFATQVEGEFDSFDETYDEDAWHPNFQVATADDLQDALNNGETNITLIDDIVTDEPIIIPAAPTTYSLRTNAVTINLNGKKLTGNMHKDNGAVIKNEGNLILKNGTVSSTANNGGSAIQNKGTLVVENVTLNGAPNADGSWPSYTVNNTGVMTAENVKITSYHGAVASYGEGVVVTLNDCEIDMAGIPGFTSHGIYTYNSGAVIVNGGVYANKAADQNSTGASVINGAVTINGGTFTGRIENYYGTPVIKGGTFSVKPNAKFVADGYKAVQSNGKYVVVSDTIADENVVGTPAELESALAGAADAGSGDNTLYLTGDIDLTGSTWTPISVDGYHGAGVITIEGNGATIKGLTAPLFAGGFAGKSGIVIKNLTIADSNIVSTSGLGGGAFIDCADSMHVITLDNCHLVNSTVSGERAGGLIGWCSGYAKLNDGPVKAYVTITNCSVVDSTVIGNGSAGGIAGHPGASDYTYTTIENCVVKNVDVISYEPISSWRTGAIVGTANNGHVVINNVTVENVTLTQDGVTATETKLFGRFVPSGTGTLVIDGAEVVATTEALKEALSAETESIAVILANDISIDIGTGWKMGGANTESITIDGNGKVLTLSNTYRSYFNLANAEGVLNLKNMTLTNTHKGTHFFDYTTHFNCDVVAENVVFAKSPLVSNGATAVFNDCAFSQAGTDIYGLWIMSGTNVTVNGGELTTDRGFKIADEDSAKELTTLKVSGTKFNNTKKAAILVTTDYGAQITLENLDITNCGADSTNAVWIDDGRTTTADKIVVTGGSVVIEH